MKVYKTKKRDKWSLRRKYPCWVAFWSVSSPIRTEHGYLQSKSPYSVQIQENAYKEIQIRMFFTEYVLKPQANINLYGFIKLVKRKKINRKLGLGNF